VVRAEFVDAETLLAGAHRLDRVINKIAPSDVGKELVLLRLQQRDFVVSGFAEERVDQICAWHPTYLKHSLVFQYFVELGIDLGDNLLGDLLALAIDKITAVAKGVLELD
jgi:hypothetical protein